MLRITTSCPVDNRVQLHLAGQIDHSAAAVLQSALRPWLDGGYRVVLQLDSVDLIDDAGLALLRRYSRDKIGLATKSLFMRTLLATHHLNREDPQ